MLDPAVTREAWDWPPGTTFVPADSGLINQTWVASAGSRDIGVVQWLNTGVFSPLVHEDIEAVTSHLANKGVPTPRLVRTRSGALWHETAGQVWRRLTWIGDRTVHKLADANDAREAGRLVAKFHAAVADLDWEFRSVRKGFHDTDFQMRALAEAVPKHREHRLYAKVAPLADALLAAWARWDGRRDLPRRVVHGDLKISNVRFDGPSAVALIDLDTMTRISLDAELGDAFRSWCNPASEDAAETVFHLGFFEAGVRGYAEGQPGISEAEWASIVPGVERIALELAARFAKDALEETYFGWNPKYGGRGEHNLLRATGQHALARSVRNLRSDAETTLRRARGR